jgi:hypothetical protein
MEMRERRTSSLIKIKGWEKEREGSIFPPSFINTISTMMEGLKGIIELHYPPPFSIPFLFFLYSYTNKF